MAYTRGMWAALAVAAWSAGSWAQTGAEPLPISPTSTQKPVVCDSRKTFAACSAVPNQKLSGMRGGFEIGNGLQVSFGIERMSYVNGQLVTQSRLTVPDLGKLNASQISGAGLPVDAKALVQLGAGNSVRIDTQALPLTVIQNSLDNQTIRNVTIVNTSANSMQLLRGMNPQIALRDALTVPLAGR